MTRPRSTAAQRVAIMTELKDFRKLSKAQQVNKAKPFDRETIKNWFQDCDPRTGAFLRSHLPNSDHKTRTLVDIAIDIERAKKEVVRLIAEFEAIV